MSRKNLFLLTFCFFVSGSAGLAYEVLWTRLLNLSFGHTVYAVTTVLAAFMGGLALGSWLIGKWSDRWRNPLRLYGLLEIAIGLSCLAVPFVLDLARETYLSLYPLLSGNTLLKTLVQFLLAFTVLLVPTTLMGGTLPAVVRGTVRFREETGKGVGLLYGTNTIGAAAGAVAAGYWLLPTLGIRNTNLLGVALNLAVGLAVLGIFRERSVELAAEPARKSPPRRFTTLEGALLLGFFLSGAVSMTYQIAWVRALVLVIGSSTYAFSSIVVTFLLGLALGSYLFRLVPPGEKPWFFGILQVGIGLSAFLLVPFFNYLPQVFLLLFRGHEGSFATILLIQFLIVVPFVLAPTILMGMSFPCIAGILTRGTERIGSDVGRLYAWNTLGAIAGSVAAGFVLIPGLGAQNTITLGIAVNLALGGIILALARPPLRPFLAAAAIPLVFLLILFPAWSRKAMIAGVAAQPGQYLGEEGELQAEKMHEVPEILYFREGISSTVAVVREPTGNINLKVNGKAQASLVDLETNVKLAYLPLVLHSDPRRVAVIGLGSGVTAGTAALFDGVEEIDVVELNREVLEVPPFFDAQNFSVLEDPRLTVHVDDGRSFLAGAGAPYDVVISEPSHLWIAGVANLFTREFASLVKSRLAPGGIFCQWVQGYSLSPDIFNTVVRTFRKVFPDSSLWQTSPTDYLLLGMQEGWEPPNLKTLMQRIGKSPRLAEAFRDSFRDDPLWATFRSFRLEGEELERLTGDGPVNSDDRNRIEFEAPRVLYRPESGEVGASVEALQGLTFPALVNDPLTRRPEFHLRFREYLLGRGQRDEASLVLRRLPSLAPPLPEGGKALSFGEEPVLELSFDGEPPPPLIPQVGLFRPEEGEAFDRWSAHVALFKNLSGVAEGEGVGGSPALMLKGLGGVAHLSYIIPLAVDPATGYTVTFSSRSDMGPQGEGGVGVMEYRSLLPPQGQPTLSFNRAHQVRLGDMVRLSGPLPDWQTHSFSIRTTPETRMAFLVFYREGAMDAGPVFFDELRIARTPK